MRQNLRSSTKAELFAECARLRRENARLTHLAYVDQGTKLYRKEAFFDCAQRRLYTLSQESKPASLLMIDLDHFKELNDTHGHARGDEVLASIAAVIREYDIAGRYGGDEFVVLLPDEGSTNAHAVAERIRKAVEDMRFSTKDSNIITVSIGISSTSNPGCGYNLRQLLLRADTAMYAAKQKRNAVRFVAQAA